VGALDSLHSGRILRHAAACLRRIRGRSWQCGGAFAALALAVSCTKAPEPELRVGISDFPPYKLALLADALGYYKAAGVKVRLVEFSQLSDSRRAYELGAIDGMATTLTEVLIAQESAATRNPQVVRVIDYSEGADAIVASTTIRNVDQLARRRVGVEPGAIGLFLLGRALAQSGLALVDCQIVPLSQPAIITELRRGSIDAAVAYAPFLDQARSIPGVHVLFSSKDLPGEIVDVFAFSPDSLRPDRNEVSLLLGAFNKALESYRTDPGAACLGIARRAGGDPIEIRRQMEDGIRLVDAAWQPTFFGPSGNGRSVLAATADVLRKGGVIGPQPIGDAILNPR